MKLDCPPRREHSQRFVAESCIQGQERTPKGLLDVKNVCAVGRDPGAAAACAASGPRQLI